MWKLVAFFVLSVQLTAVSQVSNNTIFKPILLSVDSIPIQSSTKNLTVEWQCIDKALTKKCLVYHNDQWFLLNVPVSGKYYLNIGRQQCNDKRGLQLILIEGDPCKITTYKIKKCISKIPQDDTFVELDSLQAGIPYLVNVDGFLGDLCAFEIQLATRPEGLPYDLKGPDTLSVRSHVNGKTVMLRWQVSNDLAGELEEFKIYRLKKGAVKSFVLDRIPLTRNAQGRNALDYIVNDSLNEYGIFTYRIIGVMKSQEHYLLGTTSISFFENTTEAVEVKWVTIPIDLKFKNRAEIEVSIYDPFSGRLLHYFYHTVDRSKGDKIDIDIGRLIVKLPYKFVIKLQDQKRRKVVQQFVCRIDERGDVSLE